MLQEAINLNSSVRMVTAYVKGYMIWAPFLAVGRTFLIITMSRLALGPTHLLSNGCQRLFPWDKKECRIDH